MKYTIRPLGPWTEPVTADRKSSGTFRASWDDTLGLLHDEVDQLDGVYPIVIQVDVTELDLRQDGMLRTRAQVGNFPGVVISFSSRFGPLRYATDAYEQFWSGSLQGWQANVRAIALALAALRAVDRYGVSKRGQQYTGWKALPSGGSVTFPGADEALRWMREKAGGGHDLSAREAYRNLARRLHPDAGGDQDDWDRLGAAKLLLTSAGML